MIKWGAWGPVVYMLLYAVGPSFLVPGAVMTIAGGLAFGAKWGSVYSLIGGDIGAIVAFAAGDFSASRSSSGSLASGSTRCCRESRSTASR